MKKTIQTLVICFLLFQSKPLWAQYEWRHRACPIAHQGGGISFALGTHAYVMGGDTAPPSSANIANVVWEYDANNDTWTQKNNFPHSANNPACFVINDTAYVGLGLDNTLTYHNDFWRYEQASDQWTRVADFPGSPRYAAMTFALNGKGYLGCGHGGTVYNDFYAYDPSTNTWAQKANFPGAARQTGVGAAAGGKGYIGLGAGSGGQYSDIYRYNDTLNSWAAITSLSGARQSAGAFVINDTIYIVGGMDGNTFFHDCWSYNASGNSWTAHDSFSNMCISSVFIQDGFTIKGHGYCRPISNSAYLHILMEYGPRDTSFTQTVHVLGNDTMYNAPFTRVLTAPDSSAVWSTGAVGPNITVSSLGRYSVRWNTDCGVAGDAIAFTNKSGIEMLSEDNQVEVYPNPLASGEFNLKVAPDIIGSSFEIFDLTGRLIFAGKIKDSLSAIEMNAESGIYSLKVTRWNKTYQQKLIKL